MKIIKASNGQDIQVDDCYYEYLNQFTWTSTHYGYVMSRMGNSCQSSSGVYMHLWVAAQENLDCSHQIDHKDRNPRNNQSSNLRSATQSQNQANSVRPLGNYSKYRGVTWHKISKKWFAQLSVNNKRVLRRRFATEIEAAKAYDKAAFEHFGEFATLNFPEDYAHLLGN